jgi:hypothetical protein
VATDNSPTVKRIEGEEFDPKTAPPLFTDWCEMLCASKLEPSNKPIPTTAMRASFLDILSIFPIEMFMQNKNSFTKDAKC